ncbi:uncharacterized protein LOC135929302 isoform X2 [Gordionus sp. m RMFG-2023]|uniref:uncharacterized protein LOC135929302 isoform X2 n=1 Tax=Gordionus sp. m RMFG-2023 TaxID=3053472 RepID=UPI0031FC79D3
MIKNLRKWQKILYQGDQGFPDNYVDARTFFDGLKKNINIVNYDFSTVSYHSCIISQHINCTLLYIATIFAYMLSTQEEWLTFYLTNLQALILDSYEKKYSCKLKPDFWNNYQSDVVGDNSKNKKHGGCKIYGNFMLFKINSDIRSYVFDFLKTFKVFAIFTAFNFGLSPILASLTQSISTDTIYVLATLAFILNSLFQNYQIYSAKDAQLQIPDKYNHIWKDIGMYQNGKKHGVAFNSALFGSLCLASRLPQSPFHSFITTSLAALVFGLWPEMRLKIKSNYISCQKNYKNEFNCQYNELHFVKNNVIAVSFDTHNCYNNYDNENHIEKITKDFTIYIRKVNKLLKNTYINIILYTDQRILTIFLSILSFISLWTLNPKQNLIIYDKDNTNNFYYYLFTYKLINNHIDNFKHIALATIFINILITLIVPYIFVRMQIYKNNIYGPWDEAVIK